MTARTDVHRPADLDPAHYVEIGFSDNHPDDGGSWIDPDYRGLPSFDGHYARRGGCDHCGHGSIRYACHYLHEPGGEVVTVGTTCAGKLGLPDKDRLRMIERAKATAKADRIEALRREYPIAVGVLDSYAAEVESSGKALDAWYAAHGDEENPSEPRPRVYRSEFLDSLSRQLRRKGELSAKQIRALARTAITNAERQAERDAEAAAEPEAAPVPEEALTGRTRIEGKIAAVKFVESAYGTTEKMLVLDDRGFRVWGTRPDSLLVPAEGDTGWIERDGVMCRPADRGDRVAFAAAVEVSDDDPTFAFYKRPTKCEYLGTPEIEAAEIEADLRERAEAEIDKLDRRIEATEAEAAVLASREEVAS